MKLKVIFNIILLSIIISCKDKIDNKSIGNESEIIKEYSKIDVEGHTFFKVTETDSGKILFKPCGANFEKYVMFGDSIFHHLGQEHFMFKITSKEISENQIIYKLIYKYNLEVPDTADSLIKIIPLDKNQKYWKINNDIFIDSIFSNTIPIHKELPCDEVCYDCPIIDNLKGNKKITGTWKVNCENGNASIKIEEGSAFLEIMFNQIYIDMIEIKGNNSEKEIRYKLKEKPEDLGSFATKMDWENFVNDKPIATIKEINEKTIYFYWYGFYNSKTKKREFTECEFQQEINEKNEGNIVLVKCKSDQ
ncbi:hypothetical protein [Flavobacterium gyeonganense]|uniref:Lipoprotein n=1 Tax=Flavobacterium gyeonganense TaxID=1310418 RepID=A0ABV5HFG8_9FLAO|nr:hypothetical protein [Flavobacterium gyeonganense]